MKVEKTANFCLLYSPIIDAMCFTVKQILELGSCWRVFSLSRLSPALRISFFFFFFGAFAFGFRASSQLLCSKYNIRIETKQNKTKNNAFGREKKKL